MRKDFMFSKVVEPCTCEVNGRNYPAYAKIEFIDGNLSICGVIGPTSNGNCIGSAGQCVDEIRAGKPTADWTSKMLQKFCDIWDNFHLNDMRPYCGHMKEMGWDIEAQEKIKVVKWNVKYEILQKSKDAEKRAIKCLRNGILFVPTPEETMYANAGLSVTTYNDELPEHPEFYELREKDCLGRSNVEYKMRGWISYSDHPLGFIGRPCPVCGYKYGTSWIKEEVTEEVVEWLYKLPYSKREPAWI